MHYFKHYIISIFHLCPRDHDTTIYYSLQNNQQTMATTYKLVQRRDMHKGATEGDKLYYAQAKSTGTSDMERLCSMIG